MEEDDGAGDREGEGVGEGFVEGGLPPEAGMEVAEGPAEAVGGDGGGGIGGEEGDLLAGEGLESALAAECEEAAVVGEHFEADAWVLFGEGYQVADVAKGVVFALAGGT